MRDRITVVGAGLAGSEAALQLAARGHKIDLIEMRPRLQTPAHKTSYLAELVCSNSLKSTRNDNASGLLKRELDMLGCRLLKIAQDASVPAGHALAVDREVFSRKVTEAVKEQEYIRVVNQEKTDLEFDEICVIATGPLTSTRLSKAIKKHFGSDHMYFYDAISISVNMETVNTENMFRASRYGKGGADYFNIPLDRSQYLKLVEYLIKAPKTPKRDFEDSRCFEACLPVEVSAGRGVDTPRFGVMKPRGLADPVTGAEPYAVIQLRQESMTGSMYGLVGFQTRLTRKSQKGLLSMIPGLENAEILRWGGIHRNTYIDSPRLLDSKQMSRTGKGLFFSGQLAGVEGYVESIGHGLLTALNIDNLLRGKEVVLLPPETILGGIQRYLAESERFQPVNANFGLLPPVRGGKRERKRRKAERSISILKKYIAELGIQPDRSKRSFFQNL